MRNNAGFWFGMGAGVAAGALVGMMMPHGKRTMKTQVGKGIQKLVNYNHKIQKVFILCGTV